MNYRYQCNPNIAWIKTNNMAATNLSTQERSTDKWINDWEGVKFPVVASPLFSTIELSKDDLEEVKNPVVASPLCSTIEISDDNTNLLKATNLSTQERSTDVWIKRDHTCVDDWEEAPFPGVASTFSTNRHIDINFVPTNIWGIQWSFSVTQPTL